MSKVIYIPPKALAKRAARMKAMREAESDDRADRRLGAAWMAMAAFDKATQIRRGFEPVDLEKLAADGSEDELVESFE